MRWEVSLILEYFCLTFFLLQIDKQLTGVLLVVL